jgi:hypothetical protein
MIITTNNSTSVKPRLGAAGGLRFDRAKRGLRDIMQKPSGSRPTDWKRFAVSGKTAALDHFAGCPWALFKLGKKCLPVKGFTDRLGAGPCEKGDKMEAIVAAARYNKRVTSGGRVRGNSGKVPHNSSQWDRYGTTSGESIRAEFL